jgi:DNA gyrase subunit A
MRRVERSARTGSDDTASSMTDTQTPPPAPSSAPVGRVEPRLIEREMSESYLNYALSVIHSRALPDVRDGLKPSQRRILVALNDLKLRPSAKYRKCANIAGHTSGEYHPHGESVIYPTLVRMAQPFSLRYPLIDGQGNFGSIDGDPPAAMRYTEARMDGTSVEMMADLDKETVELQPNYDERLTEPTVLPARFPNLLCNGSDGIAVGMATSLPPHNLREIASAIRAVLADPKIPIGELCGHVSGPDFPTGGIVMGRRGILQSYGTGRGRALVRGRFIVEDVRSKQQVVFTEIPFQVRKGAIIEKIVEVVRDGRISGISDLRDESDRDGIRLVVELKKGEDPQVVVNQLFQYTPLQTTFSIINLAIHRGRPVTLTLRGLIDAWIEHRKEVVRARTRFLLKKAEERKHIVEGLRIAIDAIDAVIRIVRAAATPEAARDGLMAAFGLSLAQAQAIVDMRLARLTGLEREKLEKEFEGLLTEIKDLNDILAREARVIAILLADLDEVEKRFGDERRTEIREEEVEGSFDIEELITEEMMVVTFSHAGYVKRVPLDEYRAQGRGGRGVKGSETKEGDVLKSVFVANTHDYLLFFSNRGKVYWQKVYQVPEGSRVAQGRSIRNILPLEDNESIHTMLRVRAFDGESAVFFATKHGTVKKTPLEAFSRPKRGGIWAIALDESDELVAVGVSRPGDTIIVGTAKGKAIRFDEKVVRAMGRTAHGVRGIKLLGDDRVVDMLVAHTPEGTVFTSCEGGYGKRTPLADYPIKNRGGQGVINIKTGRRNGLVVALALSSDGDDVILMTQSGMIVRSPVTDMRPMGRGTQGVRIINLKDDDRLVGAEIIEAGDQEMVDDGETRHLEIDPAEEAAARASVEPDEPDADLDDEPDDEPENGAAEDELEE